MIITGGTMTEPEDAKIVEDGSEKKSLGKITPIKSQGSSSDRSQEDGTEVKESNDALSAYDLAYKKLTKEQKLLLQKMPQRWTKTACTQLKKLTKNLQANKSYYSKKVPQRWTKTAYTQLKT